MSLFKCSRCYYECDFECKHTKCGGMIIEEEKKLDLSKQKTQLYCIMCGKRYVWKTIKYVDLLNSLGVDYSRRI